MNLSELKNIDLKNIDVKDLIEKFKNNDLLKDKKVSNKIWNLFWFYNVIFNYLLRLH